MFCLKLAQISMFDTHAHVNFNAYKNDFDEVIKRAIQKNIAIINVGSQLSTSQRAVEMAQKYDPVYASVGLHPIHLEDMRVQEEGHEFVTKKEDFDYDKYKKLAEEPNVVAIGEAGLDYFHVDKTRKDEILKKQRQVFLQHIELANEMDLPLIVHYRATKGDEDRAYHDILEILRDNPVKNGGVMHCYAGSPNLVAEFVELGFYIGFNGILVFDKTGRTSEILAQTPNNRILIETDCPYLAPPPHRGKRNEPAYVEFVAKKIAELKGLELDEIVRITDSNARKLFKI